MYIERHMANMQGNEMSQTIKLDIPETAAERVAQEDAARECQCPKCGRLHHKLAASPPPEISNYISHADLCRLSRAFNASPSVDLATTADYRINRWLEKQISGTKAR
jgi:hypothetical protein